MPGDAMYVYLFLLNRKQCGKKAVFCARPHSLSRLMLSLQVSKAELQANSIHDFLVIFQNIFQHIPIVALNTHTDYDRQENQTK